MANQTGVVPRALQQRPDIDDLALVDLMAAFWMLSSSRPVSQGAISGILLAEIRAYLDLFPQFDRHRFVEIIKRLDHEYLNAMRKRMDRKRQARQ